MKELTGEEILNLKWGDKVHRFENGESRRLRFVGLMPTSKDYAIFCDGEYTTHLFILRGSPYRGRWFIGQYDSKFIGQLKLDYLNKKIETVNNVYMSDD